MEWVRVQQNNGLKFENFTVLHHYPVSKQTFRVTIIEHMLVSARHFVFQRYQPWSWFMVNIFPFGTFPVFPGHPRGPCLQKTSFGQKWVFWWVFWILLEFFGKIRNSNGFNRCAHLIPAQRKDVYRKPLIFNQKLEPI